MKSIILLILCINSIFAYNKNTWTMNVQGDSVTVTDNAAWGFAASRHHIVILRNSREQRYIRNMNISNLLFVFNKIKHIGYFTEYDTQGNKSYYKLTNVITKTYNGQIIVSATAEEHDSGNIYAIILNGANNTLTCITPMSSNIIISELNIITND